jgi:hypothetical protein
MLEVYDILVKSLSQLCDTSQSGSSADFALCLILLSSVKIFYHIEYLALQAITLGFPR